MELREFSDGSSQVDWFVTVNLLMPNICYCKVAIMERVADKARHSLSANGVFYCVQKLQTGLLEHVLQEPALDEVVHAFEDCDPQARFLSSLPVPQLGVELDVQLQPVGNSERDDTQMWVI